MTSKLAIVIQYCGGWGYKRFYNSLVDALNKEFPNQLSVSCLIDPGTTGNFEIVMDGKLIHSKRNGKGKCESADERNDVYFAIRAKLQS